MSLIVEWVVIVGCVFSSVPVKNKFSIIQLAHLIWKMIEEIVQTEKKLCGLLKDDWLFSFSWLRRGIAPWPPLFPSPPSPAPWRCPGPSLCLCLYLCPSHGLCTHRGPCLRTWPRVPALAACDVLHDQSRPFSFFLRLVDFEVWNQPNGLWIWKGFFFTYLSTSKNSVRHFQKLCSHQKLKKSKSMKIQKKTLVFSLLHMVQFVTTVKPAQCTSTSKIL